jgi:hypothetical protein
MGEAKKHVVGEMLGKEDGALSTAGWTQIEARAREWPEVVMARLHGRAGAEGTDQPAFGIRTADTSHALQIVATGTKPLPDLLDTFKAIPAVGGGVLLIVLGAEVAEVVFEYGLQLVATTGNVPVRRHARDRDRRAHMNVYGRKWLRASDSETDIERHIIAHSPDAFSSLRSCEGAGDARRSVGSSANRRVHGMHTTSFSCPQNVLL